MKSKISFLMCIAIAAVLFTGCSPACTSERPNVISGDYTLRIVNINNGVLLLGGETAGDVYTLNTENCVINENGKDISADELETGMTITFNCSSVAETYPAKMTADKIDVVSRGPIITDLMFTVFDEVYEIDSGLNSGVEILGYELDSVTSLTDGEKAAFMHAFSNSKGYSQYVSGTFEELSKEGYINAEELYWEDGMHMRFVITEDNGDSVHFTAEKWRSGTGAIFLINCKGEYKNGEWEFTPGSFAIS